MNVMLIVGTIGVLFVIGLSVVAILDVLTGNRRHARARQRRGKPTQREHENSPVARSID